MMLMMMTMASPAGREMEIWRLRRWRPRRDILMNYIRGAKTLKSYQFAAHNCRKAFTSGRTQRPRTPFPSPPLWGTPFSGTDLKVCETISICMRAAKVFCTTLAGNPFYIFFLLQFLLLLFFGFWLEIALGIELNCFGNPRENYGGNFLAINLRIFAQYLTGQIAFVRLLCPKLMFI